MVEKKRNIGIAIGLIVAAMFVSVMMQPESNESTVLVFAAVIAVVGWIYAMIMLPFYVRKIKNLMIEQNEIVTGVKKELAILNAQIKSETEMSKSDITKTL